MKITGLSERLLKTGIALSAAAILYSLTPIHNGNIFWHLRNGIDIVETGEIRTLDPFTWTVRGGEWIQHEWLAEVIMALSWIHLGESGPVLLKALFIGLSVLLAFKAAVRSGGDPAFSFVFGAMWLVLAQPRWIARPHFFTIFFFCLYLYILSLRVSKPVKFTLILLPLQLLWVNIHAGFVMGVFLSAIPAIDLFMHGKFREMLPWLLPPFAMLLASGAHPNGFLTLEYLPSFLAQPIYKASIREWWSPFDPRYAPERAISRNALLLVVLTAGTLILCLLNRRKIQRGKAAALSLLVASTVFAARNGELLAPAMLAWIPGMIGLKLPFKSAVAVAAAVFAIPFLYGVPRDIGPPRETGLDVDWSVYPVALSDLLDENPSLLSSAVLFNTNEIAGYLQYRFGERLPLFIDGRCLLFPESFHENYLILSVSPWERHASEQHRLMEAYGFNLLLYNSWKNGSSQELAARLPWWVPIHFDPLTAAYAHIDLLRETGLESLGMRHYDPLDPASLLERPVYLIPNSAALEMARFRTDLKAHFLEPWIDAVAFRRDSFAPTPSTDFQGLLAHTMGCWIAVRGGNMEAAFENAVLSLDQELIDAVSLLKGESLSAEWSVMGIHREMMVSPWHERSALMSALWVAGQQQEALSLGMSAIDSLPGWGIAQCAWLHSLAGDTATAMDLIPLALSRSQGPMVMHRVANAYFSAGLYSQARDHCMTALDLSPDFSDARLLLANCLWELSMIQEAVDEYRRLQAGGVPLPGYAAGRIELIDVLYR